jgi:hypothetical protein
MKKQSSEAIWRFVDCVKKMSHILKEHGTVDSTMLLLRDSKNSWQLHLKLTKDELDFFDTNRGEIIFSKKDISELRGPRP